MPILIMGLIALLAFVTILALVCSAGVAERREREQAARHAVGMPEAEETPAARSKSAAA